MYGVLKGAVTVGCLLLARYEPITDPTFSQSLSGSKLIKGHADVKHSLSPDQP